MVYTNEWYSFDKIICVIMKYMVDIDGTICYTVNSNYEESRPYKDRIEHLNGLYEAGNEIHYYTARGSVSGDDWQEFTVRQLMNWGVRATTIKTGKKQYDIWIDDKAISDTEYFKQQGISRS